MGLKEMRRNAGMSQKEAAAFFGIKYRTYQNYENGLTSPTMEDAAMFARHFNCTIGDLFDLEEGLKPAFSAEELELLDAFRALDAEGRRIALAMVKSLIDTGLHTE